MQKNKNIILAAIAGIFLMACAEKEPVFRWITDASVEVEANDKMLGYEFYAKW